MYHSESISICDNTQATSESIVGNEGVDTDAMSTVSTGFASFKETGARVPILADEGSKATVESRTWTQQLAGVWSLAPGPPARFGA